MTPDQVADECRVDGCTRRPVARGLCNTCYARWRRNPATVDAAPRQRIPGRLCAIEDCGRPHHSLGLCGMHRARLAKHHDVHHDTYERMILARVDTSPGPDSCWPWRGQVNRGGYGVARYKRRTTTAHRAIYRILVGPIPDGLELDHLCRNRLCVNPAHLEPVTHLENVRRAYR